jgi:pyruvate kinase
MIEDATPTRAEVSDVANAILDGTDAVMLSGETAVGKFPERAVRVMGQIIQETELHLLRGYYTVSPEVAFAGAGDVEAVVDGACLAAREVRARALVVFTDDGLTAKIASAQRPEVPVYAFSPSLAVRRELALCWGVVPMSFRSYRHPDSACRAALRELLKIGALGKHEQVVFVSGHDSCAGADLFVRVGKVS